MPSAVFGVQGMTCQHCVAAVTEEVRALPGVLDVAVDLERAELRLASATPIDPAAVADAVDEAGYRLVAPVPR